MKTEEKKKELIQLNESRIRYAAFEIKRFASWIEEAEKPQYMFDWVEHIKLRITKIEKLRKEIE